MLKNNIKIFLSYIFIIFITLLLLLLLNKLFVSSMLRLNKLPIKAFFVFLYIILFYISGKTISVKERPRFDFLSYSLVSFVGLITLVLANLAGGINMSENMNILMLPAQVFLSPYTLLASILGSKVSIINYIIFSIIISFFIGISAKRKRVVVKYKKRY